MTVEQTLRVTSIRSQNPRGFGGCIFSAKPIIGISAKKALETLLKSSSIKRMSSAGQRHSAPIGPMELGEMHGSLMTQSECVTESNDER